MKNLGGRLAHEARRRADFPVASLVPSLSRPRRNRLDFREYLEDDAAWLAVYGPPRPPADQRVPHHLPPLTVVLGHPDRPLVRTLDRSR